MKKDRYSTPHNVQVKKIDLNYYQISCNHSYSTDMKRFLHKALFLFSVYHVYDDELFARSQKLEAKIGHDSFDGLLTYFEMSLLGRAVHCYVVAVCEAGDYLNDVEVTTEYKKVLGKYAFVSGFKEEGGEDE
jgi:hypothetical protein